MAGNANRTFICSVLFLDIVEYSKRAVTEQLRLKERFNAVLSEAISGVAADDRIILDTGDGAAVSFLGDPEDAMFVGLCMRDAIAGHSALDGPPLLVRFGLNLGPVRLVKDINGQPNIIGDGINVAQRVMSFADPGQILVSRSYYDVIAHLSDDYANLFHYEGSKTDKHVREHEVYGVGAAPRNLRLRNPVPAPRRKRPGLGLPALLALSWGTALAVNRKLLFAAPLAFLLIVGSAAALRGYRGSSQDFEPLPPAKPQTPTRPGLPRLEASARVEGAQRADAAGKARNQQGAAAGVSGSAAGGDPMMIVTALPWAEVYVNGKKVGVSPPLRQVALPPGKHQIELKNSSYPAHVETINVKPGDRVTIRHKFR